MKILFATPPSFFDPGAKIIYRETPPLALYSLMPILEQSGHEVFILDSFDFLNMLQESGPILPFIMGFDLVAISANTGTWPFAKRFLDKIPASENLPPIVLGGIHPTLFDSYVLETTPAQYVVRGEGEKTFPELLRALKDKTSLGSVPGVTYKEGGKIIKNEDRPLLNEAELMNLLPPNFEKIRPHGYFGLAIETSRGCLFNCVFCSIAGKICWRGVPPEAILRRVKHAYQFIDKVSERYLFFVDDCFTADVHRVESVCDLLAEEYHDIQFGLEGRVTDLVKPRIIDTLAKINLKFLQVGVECGYEEGLRKIKKGLNLGQVTECARLLADKGLIDNTKFSYIVGFPWETGDMIKETINFAFELANKYGGKIQVNWLNIFPGSDLYEKRHEYEMAISSADFDIPNWHLDQDLFCRSHPHLTPDDISYASVFLSLLHLAYPRIELHSDIFFKRDSMYSKDA